MKPNQTLELFELTQQEIADRTGCTQQAVYALLKRAMRKYKDEWIRQNGIPDLETLRDSEYLMSELPDCKQLSFLL